MSLVRPTGQQPGSAQRYSPPVVDSTKVPLSIRSDPYDKYVDPDNVAGMPSASNDHNPLIQAARRSRRCSRSRWRGPRSWALHRSPRRPSRVSGGECTVSTTSTSASRWSRDLAPYDERALVGDLQQGRDEREHEARSRPTTTETSSWSSTGRRSCGGGHRRRSGNAVGRTFVSRGGTENPVGSVSLPTTLDQTYRYAGASGDRSPMHVDDEVARSLGFPRKFNQGLCTLAVTSRGLIDLAAGGDPGIRASPSVSARRRIPVMRSICRSSTPPVAKAIRSSPSRRRRVER